MGNQVDNWMGQLRHCCMTRGVPGYAPSGFPGVSTHRIRAMKVIGWWMGDDFLLGLLLANLLGIMISHDREICQPTGRMN